MDDNVSNNHDDQVSESELIRDLKYYAEKLASGEMTEAEVLGNLEWWCDVLRQRT